MSNIKSISIPTPCHQSWQQMEQKEQGRYCTSCTKIVVDFTKMTTTEILDYLAGAKNVCGRFSEPQLSGINHQLGLKYTTNTFNWKRWLVAAGLLGAGFFNRADAQTSTKVPAVQHQPVLKSYPLGRVVPGMNAAKHPHKKTQRVTAETGYTRDNKADLLAYRSDISKINQLSEPVCDIDLNASTPLEGLLGGVVPGIEINTQSRIEMFYQYMPWPINKLFK